MWGISVPLAYLFGIVVGLGLAGIWLAFAVDEWVRALVMLRRWSKRGWERVFREMRPRNKWRGSGESASVIAVAATEDGSLLQ